MMKIISLDERYCSTCGNWLGARVMDECRYVYTMEGMSGRCLSSRTNVEISGSCAAWTLWRIDEACYRGSRSIWHGVFREPEEKVSTPCGKHHREIAAMLDRLNNLERNLQQSQRQFEESSIGFQSLLEECDEAIAELAKHERQFSKLSLFGESFLEMQKTLAGLSQTLKQEKNIAVESAAAMGANIVTVERLSANLRQVAVKAHGTASSVGLLTERADLFSGVASLIKEIADHTNQLALDAATSEISTLVSAIQRETLNVNVDHLIFKLEIYKVFMGLSQKKPEDFASHPACRLGKWHYEGDGKDCFSRLSGYAEIEPPHVLVRKHGRAALEHCFAGNLDEAFININEMEKASFKVTEGLGRLAASGADDASLLCHRLDGRA